jgi:hypothetical protein
MLLNMSERDGFVAWLGIVVAVAVGAAYLIFSKPSAPPPSATTNPAINVAPGFKQVSLDNEYAIQVPSDCSIYQVTPHITNLRAYSIRATSDAELFFVALYPYMSSESPIMGTQFTPPKWSVLKSGVVSYGGTTLSNSFKLSNGLNAYWGVQISDTDKDGSHCSMNSGCTLAPPDQRYNVVYTFAVPDPANKVILVFSNDLYQGAATVNGFEGAAAILHNSILPSLISVASVSTNVPSVTNIWPSGGTFTNNPGYGFPVTVTWTASNIPSDVKLSLNLLSEDGARVIGSLGNTDADCTNIPAQSIDGSYLWNARVTCLNGHSSSVASGTYRIGIQDYTQGGIFWKSNNVVASGQSNVPFAITAQ